MKKRALISVSDKTGVVDFAKELVAAGFEIISTGGTKKVLDEAGVSTIGIEEVTKFPEMMDGRVKTLHPLIHGGLLARRDLETHVKAMVEHGIHPIDVVCVNLYPFKETIQKAEVTLPDAIEQIDIGGPSMLRSAAKNHQFVTVVMDSADYAPVLAELADKGVTELTTRQKLAAKVFRATASYDALIADYLTAQVDGTIVPENFTPTYTLKQTLRYGENSQQTAAFYQDALPVPYSIASAKQIHGKALSYNNIKDADAAISIMQEFSDGPAAVAVKHMNPCGVGVGATLLEAYQACYAADPVSIFGGIVVLNRPCDLATAELMHQLFLEIIIAPSFADDAFAILAKKKNLRLMTLDFSKASVDTEKEVVSVMGGLLVQDRDNKPLDPDAWQVVTDVAPTAEQMRALIFAWKVVKHVKSNAIVVTTATQTLGIGAGQMNRVGSVKIAIEQAGDKAATGVLASDAFFPMNDSVEYAALHGIKAIVQTGGSIRDQDSIDMANKYGIAMVTTGVRHFRH